MILSKQPGDTGVFATATSSRLVVYDLQSMNPVDFFSTPWYQRAFAAEAGHTVGFTSSTQPSSFAPPLLSTQALHVSGAARTLDLSSRLAARHGGVPQPPMSSAEHSGTHAYTGLPPHHGSSGAPSLRAPMRGDRDGGDASGAVVSAYRWGAPLPPRLVIDLRLHHHHAASAAAGAPGDASFAGSAMATTAAGYGGPASQRPGSAVGSGAADANVLIGRRSGGSGVPELARPLPPPSSVPSYEIQTGGGGGGGRRGRGTNPSAIAGAQPHVYSQYTGSLVNNSFLSTSNNSATGGAGFFLPEPTSLSLSCGSPQFQLFMSDKSGAAWIGTSSCPTVTRIHVRRQRPPSRQTCRLQHRSARRETFLASASSYNDLLAQQRRDAGFDRDDANADDGDDKDESAGVVKATHGRDGDENGDDDDNEEDDEEGCGSGDAGAVGGEKDTTTVESSGVEVNVLPVRTSAPTAVFPSRVTASGWDPRSATTLALGRHDGVVQLLDVEYLVGGHRVGGAAAAGADVLGGGGSGTFISDDNDPDGEDDDGDVVTGRGAAVTTTYAGTNSNNDRRGARGRQTHRTPHHTFVSASTGASAARIEYSTVQQCLLDGPVAALDWVPQSHSAVVASRRQSGLGFSMRLLDLRTPDKGVTFGGDGDMLCCAERIACDPSQRFVASVASEAHGDVVQLWDVRLTAKPLTYTTYARVGYTSLCWTGSSSARDVRGGYGGGGGITGSDANTITLLGVTRRGKVRVHDFMEDSNGFPLMDGTTAPEMSAPGSTPAPTTTSRRALSLLRARCSLDEDRGGGEAGAASTGTALGPRLFSDTQALTRGGGGGQGGAMLATPSPHDVSRGVSQSPLGSPPLQPMGTTPPTADSQRGFRQNGQPTVTPAAAAACAAVLPLRLPVRVPTAAACWVSPPLPAHPATNTGDATMDTECTSHRLVGRGSRMNLPFTLLLNDQNGEVYAQVYNRYGAVATVASVSGHVLVAAGPNTFWTNIALNKKLLSLTSAAPTQPQPQPQQPQPQQLLLEARRAGSHDDHSNSPHAHKKSPTQASIVDAGEALSGGATAADGRLTRLLARAQQGFSADPLRNLAILLDEGTDKEAFILFRYGVVLTRQLFPSSREETTPNLDPQSTQRDPTTTTAAATATPDETNANGDASQSTPPPPPPVPIGQYVPGMLELISAEYQQREYLGLLDVPLPMRSSTAAARSDDDDDDDSYERSGSRGSSASHSSGDDSDSSRDSASDSDVDSDAQDEDADGNDKNAKDAHRESRTSQYASRRGSHLDAKNVNDGSGGERVARATSGQRTKKSHKKQRKAEGKSSSSSGAARESTSAATPTNTASTTTIAATKKVTLPNLRLFRGRPLALSLPGMFIMGSNNIVSTAAGGPRDAMMSGGANRDLYHAAGKSSLATARLAMAAAAAGVSGLGAAGLAAGTSSAATAGAAAAAPPPAPLAALGSLRGLLLAGMGWQRSATEMTDSARAAARSHGRGGRDRGGVPAMGSADPTMLADPSLALHEAQRISEYFVDGDGVGVRHLQEAVERRVAVLVLQDRLREASEVVAHYSDYHPLYPTLALEISAAGMAAASSAAAAAMGLSSNSGSSSRPDAAQHPHDARPSAATAGSPSATTAAAAGPPPSSSATDKSKRDRQRDMEKRLQYMHQRTSGCTFWMSLALTYIDMIVLQRPSGTGTPFNATNGVVSAGHSVPTSPSPSLAPSTRRAGTAVGHRSSGLSSAQLQSTRRNTPLSRPLSPLDAALPFATLRRGDEDEGGDGHRAPSRASRGGGEHSEGGSTVAHGATSAGVTTTTAATTAAAGAAGALIDGKGNSASLTFYGLDTPHSGLSHLSSLAQPAFFLKLLARFPALPTSDQLGMAVALLLPPRYTASHLRNLRDVLQTLSVRQYNATFHTDCALLDAAGGGAAVLAAASDRRAVGGATAASRAAAGTDDAGSRAAQSLASSAVSGEDGLPHGHRRPPSARPAGDTGRVPLPPLHPRAASPGAQHALLGGTSSGGGDGGEALFASSLHSDTEGGEASQILTSSTPASPTPPPDRSPAASTAAAAIAALAGGYSHTTSTSPGGAAALTTASAGHDHASPPPPSPPPTPSPSGAAASISGPRLLLAAVVEGMRGSLQRYVDMTGDVQTPLCYATVFGATRTATYRGWREAYRGLLNEAGCYLLRSQHDLSCVKAVRSRGGARPALRDAFQIPRPGFPSGLSIDGSGSAAASHRFSSLLLSGPLFAGARAGTSQGPAEFENPHRNVELRCNCGQGMHATALIKGAASAATSKAQIQQIPCGNPECRQRQTPMCTVCGERLEHKSTELSPERSFTWCTTCLHGGHWCHLREWFTKHNKCPVEDCLCECGGCPDW